MLRLVACSSRSDVTSVLREAELYMNTRLDSTLFLLESIKRIKEEQVVEQTVFCSTKEEECKIIYTMEQHCFDLLRKERNVNRIIGCLFTCLIIFFVVGFYLRGYYSLVVLGGLALIFFIAGIYLTRFVNRKINKDLKEKQFYNRQLTISKKTVQTDVEPGSGQLYIPILGSWCAKLWGQKMKQVDHYYLLCDGGQIEVEKSLYDCLDEGDTVNLFFTMHARSLLDVKKVREDEL